MIKYAMIKAILSALAVTAPIAETTYLDTGIYYSDIQSVVDSEGEEYPPFYASTYTASKLQLSLHAPHLIQMSLSM